jgi:hypothetical protein
MDRVSTVRRVVQGVYLLAVFALGAVGTARASGDQSDLPTPLPVPTPAASHSTDMDMRGMTSDSSTLDYATDGVLSIVIPAGTSVHMQMTGDGDYQLPAVIRLHVGDTIVLRNEDIAPHTILWAFLMPGQTDTRTLTKAGSEIYSAGCAMMPGSAFFVSIFIAAP